MSMNNKYEVKRLEPETILIEVKVLHGVIGQKTGNHVTWGIFKNGEIIRSKMGDFEIYPSKNVAEKQAEYLSKKSDE